MKKRVLSLAALTVTVALQAAEASKDTALLAGGTVNGQIKVMHIIKDDHNSYAPEDGSGYLGTLGYTTPDLGLEGLKANTTLYINGDTGLTDWDDTSKNALGMFIDREGKTNTLLGQAYLKYNSKTADAKVGRQILNTPLTKIKWSLVPNFYQAAVLTVKPINGLSLTALHIDRMAYGTRTATDFSLIGEKTGTAGVTTPTESQKPGGATSREQARFLNLGTAAGLAKETIGMSAYNVTYKAGKNFKISLWDYLSHDISNTIYIDAAYKIPVMKDTNLALEAQYLNQRESGDELAGKINFDLYGAKAKIGSKKWSAYLAYNHSNNNDSVGKRGSFFNAFGADPAYTSSIFSRNAYRQDVSAYKIGGHYTVMKGLKIMASYANYGQSKTTTKWKRSDTTESAAQNAVETDIVIVYKPTKAWMLKIFNARKTSEYNFNNTASIREGKMNHYRFVASYTF